MEEMHSRHLNKCIIQCLCLGINLMLLNILTLYVGPVLTTSYIDQYGRYTSYRDYDGSRYKHILVEEKSRDLLGCFDKVVGYRKAISNQAYYWTNDINECLEQCIKLSHNECHGFNFRKYDTYNQDQGNCQLSVAGSYMNYPDDTSTFIRDSNYDYYRRISSISDGDRCLGDCFYLLQTSKNFHPNVVERDLYVTNLNDCKQTCLRSELCNTFAYTDTRSDWYYTSNTKNCFLSSMAPQYLDAYSYIDNQNSNIYSVRCDNDDDNNSGTTDNLRCFELRKQNRRVKSVQRAIRANNIRECEENCLNARGYTCRGFNYRYTAIFSSNWKNCELTTIDTYSSNLDDPHVFTYDQHFDYYERSSYSGSCFGNDDNNENTGGKCFILYKNFQRLGNSVISKQTNVRDLIQCQNACQDWKFCETLAFRSISDAWFGTSVSNCLLSSYVANSLNENDFELDKQFDIYSKDDSFCDNDDTNYKGREAGSMTVDGETCFKGICRRNSKAGFYYCETDDRGSWNYCCRPNEYCQPYVRRCSVGFRSDQWRPCSPSGFTVLRN